MELHTTTIEIERETKHSVRYKDPTTDWVIYIPKDILGPRPYPRSLTITLEPGDE